MRYEHHIPDAIIKSLVSKSSIKSNIKGLHPDGTFISSGGRYVYFEYENSSRGMSYHVLSYIRNINISCTVIFIRSKHHASKHHADYLNAVCAAKLMQRILLGVTFKFYDCDGTAENIKTILSENGVVV